MAGPIDTNVLELMGNKAFLAVFKEIASRRSAPLKEILAAVDDEAKPHARVDKGTLDDAVKFLMGADLIKERQAQIDDFNTYYVTSGGLSAGRQLKVL